LPPCWRTILAAVLAHDADAAVALLTMH